MKDKLLGSKKMLPGGGVAWHKFKEPDYRILQTFENPAKFTKEQYLSIYKSRSHRITFETNELTALCPLTRFPDQYTLSIEYIPRELCIESKSAKFYFGAFRDYPGFIEKVADKIFQDWIKACNPIAIYLKITMNPRGGVGITVTREQ